MQLSSPRAPYRSPIISLFHSHRQLSILQARRQQRKNHRIYHRGRWKRDRGGAQTSISKPTSPRIPILTTSSSNPLNPRKPHFLNFMSRKDLRNDFPYSIPSSLARNHNECLGLSHLHRRGFSTPLTTFRDRLQFASLSRSRSQATLMRSPPLAKPTLS